MHLGHQLKKIRTEKNVTLAQVAEAIGLTSSSLSQIENDKISPSLATLESILKYYKVPMSEFFKQMEEPDLLIVRKNTIDTITTGKGSRITLLASKLHKSTMESYSIELQPGSSITLKPLPENINGERFVCVRDGEVHVAAKEALHVLNEDDSIIFKSHLPGVVENNSAGIARIIISGTPPVL